MSIENRDTFSRADNIGRLKKLKHLTHACQSFSDHQNLDSIQTATIVLNSVKENHFIPIKSLIAEIKSLHGYSMTRRKILNKKL